MRTKAVAKAHTKKRVHHTTTHKRRRRHVGAPAVVKRAVSKAKSLATNDLFLILAGAGLGGFAIPKLADMLPESVKPYQNYIPLALGVLGAIKGVKNHQLQMLSVGVACAGINPALKELKLISDPFVSDPFVSYPHNMYVNAPAQLSERAMQMIVENYKKSEKKVTGYGF
jgi:hypothetical protein